MTTDFDLAATPDARMLRAPVTTTTHRPPAAYQAWLLERPAALVAGMKETPRGFAHLTENEPVLFGRSEVYGASISYCEAREQGR